jgi:hypothetical protein
MLSSFEGSIFLFFPLACKASCGVSIDAPGLRISDPSPTGLGRIRSSLRGRFAIFP